MFKTVLFAAAAAAACSFAAAPSIAAPIGGALTPAEGAIAAPDAAPAKATKRTHETRYCAVGTITGSILQQKECHTRQEWIDLTGNDPAKQN